MIRSRMPTASQKTCPSIVQPTESSRLEQVVSSPEEFDRLASRSLPLLLDRATSQTKRFLKETGQWSDDIEHEKFVLRWAAEYVERFLVYGRTAVPCRPLFLLESLVATQHSRPDPFCYHPDMLTPFGRLIDGLLARAAVSRDALIALYHHCYGWGPGQVITALGLQGSDGHRIYKNFQRWRDAGWQRTMDDSGLSPEALRQFDAHCAGGGASPADTERMVRFAQTHYRKSEPEHYPCLSRRAWEDMFIEGYGGEYRIWHFALCVDCLQLVSDLTGPRMGAMDIPQIQFRVRP